MTYAVCVTFKIRDNSHDEFMDMMIENAHASKEKEQGCLRFDVLTDESDPQEVFLYELYEDRAAFDIHLASDHFKQFDIAATPFIVDKIVKTYGDVRL